MKILAYRGKSLISKAIQWQTRSPYSHIAIQLFDKTVVEAWHKGGVQHTKSFRTLHSPGTKVDVFHVNYEYDPGEVQRYLMAQIGKKYDFGAIARFISRRDEPADDKLFCSEYALEAFPGLLYRILPSHTTPRDIVISPRLKWEAEWTV